MAESKIQKLIKSVNMTISTDSVGNATLFSGEQKVVVAITCPGSTYALFPFWGYGNTYVKVLRAGNGTPEYIKNTSGIGITVYYL